MKLDSGLRLGVAALVLAAAGQMKAAETTVNLGSLSGPVTNTGTLNSEADAVLENFSLSSSTPLTVFTTSYGGGANVDGSTSSAGGFQPNVMLFSSTGSVVAQTSGSDPMGTVDSKTGLLADSYFSDPSVAAGNYILSITNWGTTGDPVNGFTDTFGSGGFNDVAGNARASNFAVNLSTSATPPSAAPEPASFWLTLPVLAIAALVIRKRQSKTA